MRLSSIPEMKDATLFYYPLHGDTNDYSSFSKTAKLGGPMGFSAGLFGLAGDFRRSGSVVELPGDGVTQMDGGFTLAVWVYPANLTPVPGESSHRGTIAGPLSCSYQDGRLHFFLDQNDNTGKKNHVTVESQGSLVANTWTHVIVMFNSLTQKLAFVFNGRPEIHDLSQELSAAYPIGSPKIRTLGGHPPDADDRNTWNGMISDVMYFTGVLDRNCIDSVAGIVNYIVPPHAPEVHLAVDLLPPPSPVLIAFVIIAYAALMAEEISPLLLDYWSSQPHSQHVVGSEMENYTAAIVNKVGYPAARDKMASRRDAGISDSTTVHVDLGGLGYYQYNGNGSWCGFRDAFNVNDYEENRDSVPPSRIPLLILVQPWTTSPPLPFQGRFADYITLQNAPLFDFYVDEIARILKKGGSVGLWIDQDRFQQQIKRLAALLHGSPVECTGDLLYFDEFRGSQPFPKLLIRKGSAHDEL